jgi:hypothetical protein
MSEPDPEPEGQEVAQKEDNEREEEEELHLKYWIKNQELRGSGKDKTPCLICFLEQRRTVPEIDNKEYLVSLSLTLSSLYSVN